ncbi:MAG: porin [Thiotrichales bacterium]
MSKSVLAAAVVTAISAGGAPAFASNPIEERLQVLEKELQEVREQLAVTADAVSDVGGGSSTTLGGYGELHYNNLQKPSGDKKEIDFHRFVLFIGHEFSDSIRLQTEFELEHALSGDGKPGEIELEQAYVEMDAGDNAVVRAGVFLIPVGIINETHEPPTFYGVERNPVEKNILPATWWEGGVAVSGRFGLSGFSYDAALHSGLAVDPATVNIRSGREKVAKAKANNLAATGRLKYTAIPGLELAASLQFQDDISQEENDGLDSATLVTAHAIWQRGALGLRGLYAAWNLDGDAAAAASKDQQDGYYLEASYKLTSSVGVFVRHNAWSNEDNVDATQQDFGINWWPHENVVFKFDVQQQNDDAGNADGFNLGVGYQF